LCIFRLQAKAAEGGGTAKHLILSKKFDIIDDVNIFNYNYLKP